MKKYFKLSSFALYILMVLFFFVLGIYYAKYIEAGKGQMLAAGAIVLGYGVLFAFFGFLISLFIIFKLKVAHIKKINWILLIVILGLYGYNIYKIKERDKNINTPEEKIMPKSTTPTPAADRALRMQPPLLKFIHTESASATSTMGFFSPNYYEHSTFYFYGNINFEKSLMEHPRMDSMSFRRTEHHQFEIATAPPWLVPSHHKLDYDLLYFEIVSISEEFVEVIVNKTDQRTSFMDRRMGTIWLWPDFLLKVNSVEFPPESKEKVKIKPLENSIEVRQSYSFLKPLRIQGDWMQVSLMDDNFNRLDKGWIRWRRDNQITVLYNLLS